jgi:hypothetical protein
MDFWKSVHQVVACIRWWGTVMSAECERVFSFTKRFIPNDRNRLKDDVIEAMSCLKYWYKADHAKEAENE